MKRTYSVLYLFEEPFAFLIYAQEVIVEILDSPNRHVTIFSLVFMLTLQHSSILQYKLHFHHYRTLEWDKKPDYQVLEK